MSTTVTPQSLSLTHTHTFDSQLAAQPQKGQKQRGQLVFSQLICQSGPQTSDHITVNLPDTSRQRGGEAARTYSPVTLTSPWAKNSDGPGHFAQDPGSSSDGGRVVCHSSRADVTWSLEGGSIFFLNIHSLVMTLLSSLFLLVVEPSLYFRNLFCE